MPSPGFTTVSAANLCDSTGTLITNATAVFTPNLSFRTGGSHGQVSKHPVSVPVTNGALSVTLADTSLSNPANVSYRLTITDNLTGDVLLQHGYESLQPSGANWSLDEYVIPLNGPLTVVVAGPTGPPGPSTDLNSFAMANLPPIRNLFLPSNKTVGASVVGNKGIVDPNPAFTAFFFFVEDLTTFTANFSLQWLDSGDNKYGTAFYDAQLNYIGGDFSGNGVANNVWSVPAGASYARAYCRNEDYPGDNAAMIVAGSSVPSSYVAHWTEQFASKSDVSSLVTAQTENFPSLLDARLPVTTNGNLFDKTRVYAGELPNAAAGGYVSGYPTNFFGTHLMYVAGLSNVVANFPVGAYQNSGIAFYDAAGNFVSGRLATDSQFSSGLLAAGTAIPIAANVAYMAVWFNRDDNVSLDNRMVVAGTSIPSVYLPFYFNNLVTRDQAGQFAAYAGVSYGHMGDSISYGQGSNLPIAPLIASSLGANLSLDLSWPGRLMYQALSNVGNTSVPYPTQTTVQSLKVLSLWLSTNVDRSNVGTVNDTASVGTSGSNGITFPSSDSFASQTKGVLGQLLTWNPGLRIVLGSPYQSAHYNAGGENGGQAGLIPDQDSLAVLLNVTNVLKQVGQMFGCPVLDFYSNSGICPTNIVSLTVDSLHPTADTQTTRLAPMWSHFLQGYAPK